jgi:hypothetical protein
MCGKPGKGRHGTSHHAKAIYQIITPSVLNHRAYTTSSAAAQNLYDSSGLTWGKETKILMIENGRFFFKTP